MSQQTENTNAATQNANPFANLNEYFAQFGQVLEKPEYAEVFVKFFPGSNKIQKVIVLPELPSDHSVKINMIKGKLTPVARIYADSVFQMVYNKFHGIKSLEGKTYYNDVFGEKWTAEDGEFIHIDLFMFKRSNLVVKKLNNQIVHDEEGKPTLERVGYVHNVECELISKEMRDSKLKYANCVMPVTLFAKGIKKVVLLNKDYPIIRSLGDLEKRASDHAGLAKSVEQAAPDTNINPVSALEPVPQFYSGPVFKDANDDLPF